MASFLPLIQFFHQEIEVVYILISVGELMGKLNESVIYG